MTNGRRLLLVDNNQRLREMLGEQLALHHEFSIVAVESGRRALEAVNEGYYDLLILGTGLPDMDGHELCRRMRRDGIRAPIIILTAADGDADAIAGLDAGANDFVAKPFRLGVLLARIRAHIRQHERSDDAMFTIGPYSFQPGARLLIDDHANKRIRLTDKEAAILKYLYRAGNHVVAREVLLHDLWGYSSGITTHTLETHVYRLRQKMEPDPSRASILVTEQGGYRLVP